MAYTGANGRAGRIKRSLLAIDCQHDDAMLRSCVLFEGVRVAAQTQLRNAVVLPNAVIGRGCRLSNVIVGAGAQVPDGTIVLPKHRDEGETPTLITAETRNFSRYIKRVAQRHDLPCSVAKVKQWTTQAMK